MGTITQGKLADLVVLGDDPRGVAVEDLRAVTVQLTMIGGRVEYCASDASAICSVGT